MITVAGGGIKNRGASSLCQFVAKLSDYIVIIMIITFALNLSKMQLTLQKMYLHSEYPSKTITEEVQEKIHKLFKNGLDMFHTDDNSSNAVPEKRSETTRAKVPNKQTQAICVFL